LAKRTLGALLVAMAVLPPGCATPDRYTDAPMTSGGKNSKYVIEDSDNGFRITVNYSRYQFISESNAVAISCRQELTSLAHEYGDEKSRSIDPVNPDRIKISMGRNGFSGITSCAATAPVRWAEEPSP
jgi:hypothetical protein